MEQYGFDPDVALTEPNRKEIKKERSSTILLLQKNCQGTISTLEVTATTTSGTNGSPNERGTTRKRKKQRRAEHNQIKRRRKLKSYQQRKRTLTGGTGWYDSRLKTVSIQLVPLL
ncbi:PREDICTED: uncharacterized protein LOC101313062 [Fragaria vesca subsp. vesca]